MKKRDYVPLKRVLVVTSAFHGIGKTTFINNLCKEIALSGRASPTVVSSSLPLRQLADMVYNYLIKTNGTYANSKFVGMFSLFKEVPFAHFVPQLVNPDCTKYTPRQFLIDIGKILDNFEWREASFCDRFYTLDAQNAPGPYIVDGIRAKEEFEYFARIGATLIVVKEGSSGCDIVRKNPMLPCPVIAETMKPYKNFDNYLLSLWPEAYRYYVKQDDKDLYLHRYDNSDYHYRAIKAMSLLFPKTKNYDSVIENYTMLYDDDEL